MLKSNSFYSPLNSVNGNKFTAFNETPSKKPVFTPTSPKPVSTKGEYIFYKDYYYDRKTGFEWQRTR